jgi:glycosyltransferase involved in cell wall biosynthesis
VIGLLRGRAPDPRNLVSDAVAALRHAESLGHADPVLLAIHPIARVNPYQQLLYGAAWSQGVAPVPLYDLADLDLLESVAASAGVPLVLHLHWTNKILESAETEVDAQRQLAGFLRRLDHLRDGGGHVGWTVHNTLPHDASRPSLEAALQQGIVDRATFVHTLSANTPAEVADWFSIPADKVVHVPHSSYRGAYQDMLSREQARWELGIETDETVYALLGAIKPYKGTDRLLEAFDEISHSRPGRRRLVVAGLPDKGGAADAFLEQCEVHPFVLVHPRTIPADEMQLFLRSADIVVLPYLRSLNSGVLMLALTFGVPVVAPAVGGMAELVTPQVGRLFQPDDDHGLLRALEEADSLRTPEARAAARATADRFDPATLSAEFAREVRARVRTAVPAGA